MKQNDAVFKAVCSVLGFDSFSSAVELTKDQREKVVTMVTEGLVSGTVDFSTEAKAKYDNPAKVRTYTVGLVSNHIRKDKRLNGGVPHVVQNPGSRRRDPQIAALRLLQTRVAADSDTWHEIEAAVNNRQLEIDTASKPQIDLSVLPAEFHHLVK